MPYDYRISKEDNGRLIAIFPGERESYRYGKVLQIHASADFDRSINRHGRGAGGLQKVTTC